MKPPVGPTSETSCATEELIKGSLFRVFSKNRLTPAAKLKFALQEHLQDTRVLLLAHSMGGLVAMHCILSLLEEGQSRHKHQNRGTMLNLSLSPQTS
jgi:pimeloyl-ACP methyl ester carboxylesterase